ncbi:hypothetical protein CPB86DRAFT_783292 [Serendipita vermifera]|nr:hypothetical protein CPB86DRAFT_783292 [Serendipita vermifera]
METIFGCMGDLDGSPRELQGAFIDFCRFVEEHEIWGLLVIFLGLYLQVIRPYLVQTQSSIVSEVFQSHGLVYLPREIGIAEIDPVDAMEAMTPNILQHTAIKQSRRARLDRRFAERLGQLQLVRYGPGPMDCANILLNQDPSSGFYCQYFFNNFRRRILLLNVKSMVCLRVTEAHKDVQTYLAFLRDIREEVEDIMEASGLAALLAQEIAFYRATEAALVPLARISNKLVADQVGDNDDQQEEEDGSNDDNNEGSDDEDNGTPRYHGILARGEKGSKERQSQIDELQQDDELAEMMQLPPPWVWKGRRPGDPLFAENFLKAKGKFSMLRSNNGFGRMEQGMQTRREEGARIAAWNRKKAQTDREERAEKFHGDWVTAAQYKVLKEVIPLVQRDQTANKFEDSPHMGICNLCGALAIGKDRNAKHWCRPDSNVIMLSRTHFRDYERILHLHDVLEHPLLMESAKKQILEDLNLTEIPVPSILQGQDDVPFSYDPSRTEGTVYLDPAKVDSDLMRLMAWDLVLKLQCPGTDPLAVAISRGDVPHADARSQYEQGKAQYWPEIFITQGSLDAIKSRNAQTLTCLKCGTFKMNTREYSLEELKRHLPCNRHVTGKGRASVPDTGLENYCQYYPTKLTDLPFTIARVFLYRAFRTRNGKGALRKAITKWENNS